MKLIIIGAGGFAKEIAFLASRLSEYDLVGFVDDRYLELPPKILGVPVLGPISDLLSYDSEVHIAIGIANPKIKKLISAKLRKNSKLIFPNLIDPSASIGLEINKGMGNILMANTTYTADINIGDFNMINIGSTIGHDTSIGNFNAIFPSVNISGSVVIGNENEIGVGTQIIQNVSIGDKNVIGAGAVVIRDINTGTKNVGVPSKVIESWD